MKNKLFPALLVALLVAAVFVIPAFAQDAQPPVVDAPVFDWALIINSLEAILTAVLVPVAGYAARYFFAQGNYYKSLLSENQEYAFELMLRTFIYAAEQMKLKGFIDDKLTFVIDRMSAWLMSKGVEMDLDELRARIEAKVLEEFQKLPSEG